MKATIDCGIAVRTTLLLLTLGSAELRGQSVSTPATSALAARQLQHATQRYAHLVAAMDHAAIAALFTTDGEMEVVGAPSVKGRKSIRQHLETFKDYRVEAESLTADSIVVSGLSGEVAGTYRQRVRVPAGEVVEVHGTYVADWIRAGNGAWHIRRMRTTPQQ